MKKEKEKKLGKWYRLEGRIPPDTKNQMFNLVGGLPGGIKILSKQELAALWVARRKRKK